jgi:hypothetical protein
MRAKSFQKYRRQSHSLGLFPFVRGVAGEGKPAVPANLSWRICAAVHFSWTNLGKWREGGVRFSQSSNLRGH